MRKRLREIKIDGEREDKKKRGRERKREREKKREGKRDEIKTSESSKYIKSLNISNNYRC